MRHAVPLVGLVDHLHHGSDGRVEAQLLRVQTHFLDGFVENLELFLGGGFVGRRDGALAYQPPNPVPSPMPSSSRIPYFTLRIVGELGGGEGGDLLRKRHRLVC
jgi:hypothetical protein